jgi:TolB-like protein/DNA-binding winged helix-turn-helix (wHTH) protein/Tfp pilus assembly protein PilF
MGRSSGAQAVICFANFELDLEAGELRQAGRPVKLQTQPFRALAFMVERAGRLVTREEISQHIWDDGTVVDFDQSLNFCIKQIRSALGDDAKNPQFIETVPRRGYRFIAPLDKQPNSPPTVSDTAPVVAEGTPKSKRRYFLVGAGLLLVLVFFGIMVWTWRHNPTANARIMLAVLPFDNISGNRDQEYLADGMTEEMISQIGRLDPNRLGVIARASAMQYKSNEWDIGAVGRKLNVSQIATGSVRVADGRVRVTAHLIDVASHATLWTGSYDRNIEDILKTEQELAGAIAREIQIRLNPVETPGARPVSSAVHELYLKGRYFWNKRSSDKIQKAVEYFDQTIAIDPTYAPAYAGLADSYVVLAFYEAMPPEQCYPRAKAAVARALEIDDRSAEAHTTAAAIKFNYDWDWAGAEHEYKHAIKLDPNYANAHQWYATYLSAMGRTKEAMEEDKRALALDPVSPMTNTAVGLHLYFAKRYSHAVDQQREAANLDPGFALIRLNLARAYEGLGKSSDAVAELEKGVQLSGRSPVMLAALAQAYAFAGRQDRSRPILEELRVLSNRTYVSPYGIALICLALGDENQALQFFQAARKEHSTGLVYAKLHPWLSRLPSHSKVRSFLDSIATPN